MGKAHHHEDEKEEDYGKCVTPPELSAFDTDGKGLFGPVKKPRKEVVDEGKDAIGAIRTMCADELRGKSSFREKDHKQLVKTKKTEVSAKERSKEMQAKAGELRTKAAASEKAEKAASKEAATKTKNTEESVTKTGKEATQKTKATAAIGAREVTAKDKFNKIKDIADTHKHHKHVTHTAEKRVTIVQGGRDNAVEIKGKHEWQHQELVDKTAASNNHKEISKKIAQVVKLTGDKKAGKTVIEQGSTKGAEKASKTQLEAFKEFTSKENKQKTAETKTKVTTNEVLIKGGEKIGKRGSGKGGKVIVEKAQAAPVQVAPAKPDHPDKEIAAKLIKTNQELTNKLEHVNHQVKQSPNDGAVIKVLKAQVKELQAKKTPRATKIIRKVYHPPPTKAVVVKKVVHHVHHHVHHHKDEGYGHGHHASHHKDEGHGHGHHASHHAKKAKKAAPKRNCHKESEAKHPFAGLESNVKQIMKLKGSVVKAQKSCKANAEAKVKTVQKEAHAKLEKSQKMVVAAKLTLKDRESEICDKSRTASEASNKHQTHFWIGMVKEVRAKAATRPKEVNPSGWKNKLCEAVHNDVQRMAGIKAVNFLQ